MNFHLISQMTFAHLISNTMLCDNTFLCPRTLCSSPISSWLGSPQPREATKLSLFQPPGVHKEPGLGKNHQSPLCCHLDNTSPRLAFTSTSTAASGCSMPRLEELVPVLPCSCPPRGPRLFHSQVSFTSQERAPQSTFDFHSQVDTLWRSCSQVHLWFSLQVTSPLKKVLASALLTFTHKSLRCCHHPLREGLPLWYGLLLWHSHPALASSILLSGAAHPAAQDTHCWLGSACSAVSAQILQHILWVWVALYSFLSMAQYLTLHTSTRCHTGSHSTLSYLVCGASSSLKKLVLATRCHLIKIKRVLFPLTVLRSLSFLIPSFTKINMSSYPAIHLPLTFAWGLLGVCHGAARLQFSLLSGWRGWRLC